MLTNDDMTLEEVTIALRRLYRIVRDEPTGSPVVKVFDPIIEALEKRKKELA